MSDELERQFEMRNVHIRDGDDFGDGRTIEGMAVPFGRPAWVRDRGGPAYQEQFKRGAFARSINDRQVKLFGMHDRTKFPLGVTSSLEERRDGLYMSARIAETRDGDDVLALVNAGAVDSLSIGFVPRQEKKAADGLVTRTEVELTEVSVVHTPAYDEARILALREQNSGSPPPEEGGGNAEQETDHASGSSVHHRRIHIAVSRYRQQENIA